jgi:acyl carrier protein
VRRKLTDVIVWQLARVLRTREEEISRTRPLGEIGLDSLMLLEFAMNFEETFGIHVSVTSSVGALTVTSLANEVISQLDLNVAQADVTQEDVTHEDAAAAALADRHTGAARPNEISALVEIAKGAQTKGLAS